MKKITVKYIDGDTIKSIDNLKDEVVYLLEDVFVRYEYCNLVVTKSKSYLTCSEVERHGDCFTYPEDGGECFDEVIFLNEAINSKEVMNGKCSGNISLREFVCSALSASIADERIGMLGAYHSGLFNSFIKL